MFRAVLVVPGRFLVSSCMADKAHLGLITSFHLANLSMTPGGYSGIFRIGLLRLECKASIQKNNFWHKSRPKLKNIFF